MGEILGVGCTHYPPGLVPDARKPWPLRRQLVLDHRIPAHLKSPKNWPAKMRDEWGDDEGLASHIKHRAKMKAAFATLRAEIDAFKPDLIVIWGDDQYENFREEIVPPFCVQAYEDLNCQPFHMIGEQPNIWDEPNDKIFEFKAHREAAKYIARACLVADIDMPYSYKPRSQFDIGHAFANTLLFLDWDRRGFSYPVVPISVNAYGSLLLSYRGGFIQRSTEVTPPSPSPRRCFDMGRIVARALLESPWRTVCIGSASWSHAFLCEKNYFIHPDADADQQLLAWLSESDFTRFRELTTAWIEDAAQQEFLTWISLAGAMAECQKTAQVIEWADTTIFNAAKCFALFK